MAKDTLSKLDQEVVFDANVVTAMDGAALNDRMMRSIADATDVDSILSANVGTVESLKTLWENDTTWVREPVEIVSVAFNESDEQYAQGGWGFYAVIECVDADGVVHTLQTGAKTIVLKLHQIGKHAGFPLEAKVRFTGSRTKSGYNVLDMVKA